MFVFILFLSVTLCNINLTLLMYFSPTYLVYGCCGSLPTLESVGLTIVLQFHKTNMVNKNVIEFILIT